MPANIITINNVFEYNVPDSKMEAFLEWLEENAYPTNTKVTVEPEEEAYEQV